MVRDPHEIIDAERLAGELDHVLGWSGSTASARAKALEIFKAALKVGRDEIRRRFEEEGASGTDVIAANAYLIDALVRTLHAVTVSYAYPVANPTKGEQLSVVATGGYGRGELAPYSDIDLMFLLPYKKTPHTEQTVEYMLYLLWDLGLKVGHATRSVGDALRLSAEDITIRTSLLEARPLAGDGELFAEFRARFDAEIVAKTGPEFVEAKLAERDARHETMGDTRYLLEPNVKEGKGGLRDLQTLLWIAKYLYRVDRIEDLVGLGVLTGRDAKRFNKAHNFLWTVRCHLHYLTGRPEERLGFNLQEAVAERMGYTAHKGSRAVERFMKHYFLIAKDVGSLTRILCAVLEDEQKKKRFRFPSLASFRVRKVDGFRLEGGRLTVDSEDAFDDDPVNLIRLFYEAQRHRLDIHPRALRLVTQHLSLIDETLCRDAEANRLFMEILTSKKNPEKALKRLNEAGVLGRFIPDFGLVVAQMQYDMYHTYTVDEHTIRAIGILSRIEKGELKDDHPVASAVIGQVQSRRALYLAVLLHDIAKGRGGDHSEIGAEIARRLAPRLGLTDWETETVSWLVRHHLAMSAAAFKRDLGDAKTIRDFVSVVQSPERLRLLLILTVADIRAVGPNVWNGWKANLLRELYYRALDEMTGAVGAERRTERVAEAKRALKDRLAGWTDREIEEHLALGYPSYWLIFDTDAHVRHAELIRAARREGRKLVVESRVDAPNDVTEVIVHAPDHPGLFSKIAGAMALSGADIVDAKIVTLANGMVLDTFWIQDANARAFAGKDRLAKLARRIEDAVSGRLHTERELRSVRDKRLPSRTAVFKVAPRVLIDNKASSQYTVIEVNGRDRLGFLHDVTQALTELGLQIASAHVSTYGERVVDVFYVKDVFGLKVTHEEKLKQIRAALLAAIAPGKDAKAEGEVVAAE